MTLETGSKRPDYKLFWTRLILRSEEGLITLTDDQKKALRIRGLTEDLALSMGGLICDPTVDRDPEFKRRLLEKCNEDCADLGRMGVRENMFEGKDPYSLQEHLDLANYSASLLIGEEFESLPSIGTVLPEIHRPILIFVMNGHLRVVSPVRGSESHEKQRWDTTRKKIVEAWRFLGTNV